MGVRREAPNSCRLYANSNAGFNPYYPYEYRCVCPLLVDTGTTSVWITAGFEQRASPEVQIFFRERKPVLYVFPVGIPAAARGPDNAENDARDFAVAMIRQRNSGFFERVVVDSTFIAAPLAASQVGILKQLEQFKSEYCGRSRDQWNLDYFVFFFSGHGQIQNNRFYLEPAGGEEQANLIDYEDLLRDYFNPIQAKKFLFIDACREERGKKGPGDLAGYLYEANLVADATGVFLSSGRGQASWDCPEYQNGVYTEALLEALSGKSRADCPGAHIDFFTINQGVIQVSELQAFLHKRVPELSRCCGKRLQNPDIDLISDVIRALPLFFVSP